jgi:hypothetical protein
MRIVHVRNINNYINEDCQKNVYKLNPKKKKTFGNKLIIIAGEFPYR